MAEIDHLQEARNFLENAPSYENGGAELAALLGIGHALVAIAERLPRPVEWRCCNCGHIWTEGVAERWPDCPQCGPAQVNKRALCGECKSCEQRKAEQERNG